jgi:predicted nucleic acid-binding protein
MTSCFVDANVLLYTMDPRDPAKRERAAAWLVELDAHQAILISPQVLNEFVSVIARKKIAASMQAARSFVLGAKPWCKAQTGHAETVAALALQGRYGFQWWDALLMASALNAGCTQFLSEDMQHGQVIAGMRIINPFQVAPNAWPSIQT